MKIAFLVSDISLSRGGERATTLLANALVAANEVSIISLYQSNENNFFDLHSQIQQIHINNSPKPAFLSKMKQKYHEIQGLRKQLEKMEADVWIGVGTYCSILLSAMRFLSPFYRIVAWEHSNYAAADKKWTMLRQFFFKKAAVVVCLNEGDEQLYQKHFTEVKVIPNMLPFHVDTTAATNQQIIIAVGALEHEKGFDLLISAYAKVANSTDWNLKIVGSGSQLNSLKKQIEALGLATRIQLVPTTSKIVAEYLSGSLYVLPSRREGFGMVLIEAMECGLPCIAFDCETGPKHIIEHNHTGLLVPNGDITAMADAIITLITDQNRRQQLARAGKLSVEKYSQENVLAKWNTLLKQLA